jgi:tetratricopeptide (TPR) repeat protein
LKTSLTQALFKLFFGLLFCVLVACFSQKNTLFNRNLQNLTAHYNILYNANLLLDESEQNIRLAYPDNYARLIAVYPEPNETLSQAENSKLDEAIVKAYKIINEKTVSHYIGDAYFVVAKANHLKSNFFNALGFFDYVYDHYKYDRRKKKQRRSDMGQASLAWKARSLIQLDLMDEASATIDTALKYINVKKRSAADVYAMKAQLCIYKSENEEAITSLSKALKLVRTKYYRIRWTYLLAQLQQQTGKINLAYTNYTKIVRSNADFTMAFNANLNRISIEAEENGAKVDRVARLKKLFKDDNNVELIDQIYYHIGEVYEEEKDIDHAIENYKISIRKSTKNQNQKGLSYLKLADIYFNKPDYIKSKAYYDSTLLALSKDYPDYKKIQKKASNIELLANRLSTIAKENQLQQLAQLPEDERYAQIDSILAQQHASTNTLTASNQVSVDQKPVVGDQTFYFNNALALSQGVSSFKRRWGDRPLDDNWRISQRLNAAIASVNNLSSHADVAAATNTTDFAAFKKFDEAKRTFVVNVPLTPEQCIASDQRIASAYFDIATHYREKINDPEEAIRTYEKLLVLYPNNSNKLATYYNLYRLYESRDPAKSEYYRNLILNEYPESIFAKTILNPNRGHHTNESEEALNRLYNEIYCTYTDRKYPEVIQYIGDAQNQFGVNKLSPQLAYLNALAIGHTHKLDVFETSLKQITTDFVSDSLVVPLIKKQLLFINKHRKIFVNRRVALLDNDPSMREIFEEPKMEVITPNPVVSSPKVEAISSTNALPVPRGEAITPTSAILSMSKIEAATPTNIVQVPPVEVQPSISNGSISPTQAAPLPLHNGFFSKEVSNEYYFVVHVTEQTFNLSSSRFGIGQFNRTRFPDKQIKHQLKLPDNQNQLIFVGAFSSQDAVADYYAKISPLIPQIMKVPANKYRIFYISKQNFDKLTSGEVINWYIEFFKTEIQNLK